MRHARKVIFKAGEFIFLSSQISFAAGEIILLGRKNVFNVGEYTFRARKNVFNGGELNFLAGKVKKISGQSTFHECSIAKIFELSTFQREKYFPRPGTALSQDLFPAPDPGCALYPKWMGLPPQIRSLFERWGPFAEIFIGNFLKIILTCIIHRNFLRQNNLRAE